MSFPPQLSPIQERADREFLQATSNLILSVMPVGKLFYWQTDPRADLSFSPGLGGTASPLEPLPGSQHFIRAQRGHLQGGKILLTDSDYNNWQILGPDELPNSARYDQIFVGACYQEQYVGGIYLEWSGDPWALSHQAFLRAIAHHYACHYFWQKPCWREHSAADREWQDQALNLSHIHHEFRTPLTGILGFSKMLRDELYGSLNPKQHQYVQGILNSAEHLLALVNDFLDLSKINANCEELFWELVAVEDLCLAVISIVQPRARDRGLALTLEMGPGVDLCRLDQRRWKQILLNLLSNAIKFTEQGSVTLKVDRRENCLIFAVIDTGIGIDAAGQQQLFLPFKQISNAINRQQKGTGLGLVLSRKLAQLHGGDIRLRSELGRGSCFEVILPLTSPHG